MPQNKRNAPEDDLDRLIRMREEIETLEVRQTELCGNMALPDKIKMLKTELQDLAMERLSRKADLEQLHDKQKEDMTEKIEGELNGLITARDRFAVQLQGLKEEIDKETINVKILKNTIAGFYKENEFLAGTRSKLQKEITVLKEDAETTRKAIADEWGKFNTIKESVLIEFNERELLVTDRENKVERWERKFAASEKTARDEINSLRSAFTLERDDFNKKRLVIYDEIATSKFNLVNLHKEQVAKEETLDRKDQDLAINERKLNDWEKTLGKREQDLKTNQEEFAKRSAEIKWEKGKV